MHHIIIVLKQANVYKEEFANERRAREEVVYRVNRLENENKEMQDEMMGLRERLRQSREENKKLQEEIREQQSKHQVTHDVQAAVNPLQQVVALAI